MPKQKKRSAADAAKSSGVRSKKLYSAYLDEGLRNELRSWPKPDRARAGRLIQRVQDNFGNPHLHSGVGIRDLSPKGSRLNVYECRIGRGLRLIFTVESPAVLIFTRSAVTMKCADSLNHFSDLRPPTSDFRSASGRIRRPLAKTFGVANLRRLTSSQLLAPGVSR